MRTLFSKLPTIISSLFFILAITTNLSAQVEGRWKTIDDDTGEARSIVEIYKKNDKLYGRIAEVLKPEPGKELCTKCEGADHNKPIKGLTIMKDMEKDGDEYDDGTIFDPESGKTYRCKIWLDEDNPNILNVRGYIAFLFRTQEWLRE